MATRDSKQAALKTALEQIEKQFGKGAIIGVRDDMSATLSF